MDDIMIALLPMNADWCTLDLPHLTLLYSGKIEDHNFSDYNTMGKDVASLAMISNPLRLESMSIEVLGPPEDRVSALMFRPSQEILAMRNFLKRWDLSEWPEYRPHVTIGPSSVVDVPYPSRVVFDKLYLGWGDEHSLTFSMK